MRATSLDCCNFVVGLVLCYCFLGGNCQDFGYDGDEGPVNWGKHYSQCLGKHQSPIDIETHNVVEKYYHPLKFVHFDKPIEMASLENNGHTVLMKITSDTTPLLYGGPLHGVYKFAQLHFHWGPNDTIGSENQINHHSFPLEMHVVLYNTKFGFQNGTEKPGGLTVLSFLISVTDKNNDKYEALEVGLHKVQGIFYNTTIHNVGTLDDLTTTNRKRYFTYEGSLTTPPCSETVTWIEFEETIPLSRDQINAFRLISTKKGKLTHNYRPTQPLNGRLIFFNRAPKLSQNLLLCIFTFLVVSFPTIMRLL